LLSVSEQIGVRPEDLVAARRALEHGDERRDRD
jgi:hypothetical protein